MNQGKTLLFIENFNDVGQSKRLRLTGYFNEVFKQNPNCDITIKMIKKMGSLSRREITESRRHLVSMRSKIVKPTEKTQDELFEELRQLGRI